MNNFKEKLIKAVNNPDKALRYLWIAIKKRLQKKKGVLILIGADPNGELDILYPGYKVCHVFEANPQRYEELNKKYANHPNIKLYNYAVADYNGEIEFNLSSNNNGASSSIGNFEKSWLENKKHLDIKMTKTIKVSCINLLDFCQQNNINYIDDYISDIQGMDLQVLKTVRPLIEEKKIECIKCEVTKDEYGNVYDLPDNSESGFHKLLNENYQLLSKGYGLLSDNKFDEIPADEWEMDCKWKAR